MFLSLYPAMDCTILSLEAEAVASLHPLDEICNYARYVGDSGNQIGSI